MSEKHVRRKQESHEEAHVEEGEGNWLVSYADMMTLLMAFFAIMFSFSTFDQKKIDEVKLSAAARFGGIVAMPFEELKTAIEKVVKERNLEDQVRVERNGSSISIIFQGSALFESGSATLNKNSKDVISELMDILREEALQFPVTVEGHTDDTPIYTNRYPSNWELSSDRANLILRMLESKGFPSENLESQGFADTRPIAPNKDEKGNPIEENRAFNRRITIRILKTRPSEI